MNTEDVATRVRSIWAATLEVGGVGLEDSFLDLGGESIAAALCANRMRRELGISIRPAALLVPGMSVKKLVAFIQSESGETRRGK